MVEILHTISLGVEKYAWHGLHSEWTQGQQDLFVVRLQATDIDGLNVPPIWAAYIMQYRNGLIGRHFKTLMQTAAFHIYDLTPQAQFNLIKALAELGALLWMSSIEDMDRYLVCCQVEQYMYQQCSDYHLQQDLEVLINNVLDTYADIDRNKILVKIKLHVLLHLPGNIRRRGPAVRFATEVYECFNAIFRMCSVLSNHQAPSRDIAIKFADLDRVKHILSGGYWEQDGKMIQAGKDVRDLLRRMPIIQQHLGWTPKPIWTPGMVKAPAHKKRKTFTVSQTLLPECHNEEHPQISPDSLWLIGIRVTAVSGDEARARSWGIFHVETNVSITPLAV